MRVWTIVLIRPLGSTSDDDKSLKEGGVYNFGFVVHDDNITHAAITCRFLFALMETKNNPVCRRITASLDIDSFNYWETAMKTMLLILGIAGALAPGGVQAQDVLKDKGCLTCHDAATKKVGPSWKDIAAKYKDDKAAEATLVTKLKEAKGHPKVNLSDAELKAAVSQVLSAK